MKLELIFSDIPSDIQTAAFLSCLRLRGLDQEADYIAAAVTTVLHFAKTIPPELVDSKGYIDIVGTGGDGQKRSMFLHHLLWLREWVYQYANMVGRPPLRLRDPVIC